MKAYTNFSTKQTPQSEPVPGKKMVQNSAGGYSFSVDDWKRLERFLILGSEGGTYYIGERKLTKEKAECVLRCLNVDGKRTVETIVAISDAGRSPKNDPALFALAMCAGLGNDETKKYALAKLPDVARIGTHLFHFSQFVEQFRGWGRGLKTAIGNWYNLKPVESLTYQLIKYQQRDGWSNRDLLRLAHPKTDEPERNALYKWIVSGELTADISSAIVAFEKIKATTDKKEVINLVRGYDLPRECIPTQFLSEVSVWDALLENGMPMTAMIRNLGKMTEVGLLKPMSEAVSKVITSLTNKDNLSKARIHPLSILVTLKTYESGHGLKGSLNWNPVSQIVDALDEAFYLSFDTVQSTGKRWLLGLDVSASMDWINIAGMPITPRCASAAMALVTARSENNYHIMGFSHQLVPLTVSPRQRLDDVIRSINKIQMGGTDCALPMIYAKNNNIPVDVFVTYTDNETWFGDVHPFQALKAYRDKTGIPAKLIVCGMTSNNFTIAEPDDFGMMDVVGFDTVTPAVMSDFAVQ